MRVGDLYGIEIDLRKDDYPIISLVRYNFDYSAWTRIPSFSDHLVFWDPFMIEKFFEIVETNGLWTSKPLEKAKIRYWGIQNAVAKELQKPLTIIICLNTQMQMNVKFFLYILKITLHIFF